MLDDIKIPHIDSKEQLVKVLNALSYRLTTGDSWLKRDVMASDVMDYLRKFTIRYKLGGDPADFMMMPKEDG